MMHPVIELIKNRAVSRSQPGNRSDKNKLALAIEGGGMRGLVTAGMGTAIEKLGLLHVFDCVYGTSAGGFNGAYLIAGQANYGGTIYYQDINNKAFIDKKRLFVSTEHVMSLEYLVDDVAKHHKVLNCEAIIKSPIPLVILVTSANEAKPVRLRHFSSAEQIYNVLLATARLPVIAGPPVNIDGQLYYDGGVSESVPFHSALDEGATHVLVFLSQSQGASFSEPTYVEKIAARYLLGGFPEIYSALQARGAAYTRDISFLEAKTKSAEGPPFIYAVQPGSDHQEVDRLERSREILVPGAIAGFSALYRLFYPSDFKVHELLDVYTPEGHRVRDGIPTMEVDDEEIG